MHAVCNSIRVQSPRPCHQECRLLSSQECSAVLQRRARTTPPSSGERCAALFALSVDDDKKTTNNLPRSALTFPTTTPDVWSCESSCCLCDPPRRVLRAAAKAQPLPVPPGPLIVLRKVLGREGRVLSVHGPLPTNHPRRSMDIPHLSACAKDSFVLTLARVPKRHSSSGSASAPQVNILVSPPAITQ